MSILRTQCGQLSLADSFGRCGYELFVEQLKAARVFSGMKIPDDALFVGVDFEGADFSGARLNCVQFVKCDLSRADFSGASVWDAQFQSCNLTATKWSNAIMKGTAWQRCDLRDSSGLSPDGLQPGEIGATSFRDSEFGWALRLDGDNQPSQMIDCAFSADTEFGRWQRLGARIGGPNACVAWSSPSAPDVFGDIHAPRSSCQIEWITDKHRVRFEIDSACALVDAERLDGRFSHRKRELAISRASTDDEIVAAVFAALNIMNAGGAP